MFIILRKKWKKGFKNIKDGKKEGVRGNLGSPWKKGFKNNLCVYYKMPVQTYAEIIDEYPLEDYFLELDQKVVRIELEVKDGKKSPTSSVWFGNKVPSYSITNKPFSLNVFNDKIYNEYYATYEHIGGHNAIAIDTHCIYQIDFDGVDDITRDKLIDLGIPYFLSYTKKLPHFVFRDTKLKDPSNGRKAPNTFDFTTKTGGHGEILTGQWSFAQPDAKIYNVDADSGDFIDFDIIGSGLFDIKVKEGGSPAPPKKEGVRGNLEIKEAGGVLEGLASPLSECIDIEKRLNTKGCYNHYRNIVWSLASANEYDLAKKICMKGTELYDEDDFEKTYNSFMEDGGITIGTFLHMCKEDNLVLYNSLVKKKKKEAGGVLEGLASPLPLVSQITEHDDKAKELFNHYGDYFVFMNGLVYFWSDDHNKWFIDNKDYHTKKFLTEKLREWGDEEDSFTEKFETITDDKGNTQKKISKEWMFLQECRRKNKQNPEIKNVVDTFKGYLNHRYDDFKMNDKPYLLAFKNTVYDFAKNDFKEQEKQDYITMNCGYDWVEPTQEQMDLIKLLIERIFVNPEIRKCYMSVLRNGCIGVCPEKFVIANGGGRNGKGLLNDLMRCALGGYAYKGTCDTLCGKIKAGANPEVANFDKKRFITFAEPDVNYPINTATMKELSGGGEINARQLYSGKTETELEAIIVLESNEKPDLNGTDSDSIALKERIRDVLFESSFTAKCDEDVDEDNYIFKQNPYYKSTEFQQNHRCALLKYIMEYEGIDEIYTPRCVAERSQEYLLGNDKIYGFVSNEIIPEEDSWVKISDLYRLFKLDDNYINMNKSDKRKYNLAYFKTTIQKHSKFRRHYREDHQYDNTMVRHILYNFALKEYEVEDPENTG